MCIILIKNEKDKPMDLLDREGNTDGSWVRTAFNEILSSIYTCTMSTKSFDDMIDKMGLLVKNQTNIYDDEKINWQQIETCHHNYFSTLSDILDFDEIKKIISKSKIKDDEWDDISSKEIPLEKINKIILERFEENLHPNYTDIKKFLVNEKIPNELTLKAMENTDRNLAETISFEELKSEMKEKITWTERDYRNEMSPIKDATHQNFKFDIYKINKFEEWKIIKTIELISYDKKFESGGSNWFNLFHKKNGKKLELSTIENYDMLTNPEKYGIELIGENLVFKHNYITLETLNTLWNISKNEEWNSKR